MNALIVDDSESDRALLSAHAKAAYGGTVEAVEGARAFRRWLSRGERPDVCLVDLNLPDGDGHEVAQTLRQRFPRAQVIETTGGLPGERYILPKAELLRLLRGLAGNGCDLG